jgi:hypothetical protein
MRRTLAWLAAGVRGWSVALAALWVLYVLAGVGLVSSNDGSHVALARAFGAGRVDIDDDVGLTLLVDRARRGEHWYSDRPPGTAALAVPALVLGATLDPLLARRSEASRRLLVAPGGAHYIVTYAKRSPQGPPLYRRQGTALLARLHAALAGCAGVAAAAFLARLLGASLLGTAFAAWGLAFASLWGPYSTVLFGHVSSGAALAAAVAFARAGDGASRGSGALAGVAAGLACACEYTLAAATAGILLLVVPAPRRAAFVVGGVIPLVAVLAYHLAAFGSPFATGYQHHETFAFTHTLRGTFSGNPFAGLWAQWGGGEGGMLVRAPLGLVGIWGLARVQPRLAWALLPWCLLLACHRTPSGGGTVDHRYVVPALPFLAVGVAYVWDRAGRRGRWALGILAAASAGLVWPAFLAMRG